jgi:hypothetical protein
MPSWLIHGVRALLLGGIVAAGPGALPAELASAASSMGNNGVNFVFDKDYPTGRFVDGQPWVVGPVKIQRITPDYANGRHGFEVNPVTTREDEQSLDKRVTEMASRHVWVEPLSLPRTFQAGQSILKVVSITNVGNECTTGEGDLPRTCVADAAVLTVLASAPPPNSFRPPYAGNQKPIFSADIDLGAKLPNLGNVPNQISINEAMAVFGNGGVWIDHPDAWTMERIHPRDSMRIVGGSQPAEYGAAMATALMSAAVRTFQGSPAEKRELANQVIQRGIDIYYFWKNGKGYHSDGGINAGRKPAILYAGYMLSPQQPTITNAMLNLPTNEFQEDMFTYRGTREALWGDLSDGQCSSDTTLAQNSTTRRCDGSRDGGICRTGTACSGSGLLPTPDQQRSSGKYGLGAYQMYTHMYLGGATVGRVLGIDDEWNWPAFFEYTDRLQTAPWNGACKGYCSEYLEAMHRAYGAHAAPPGGGGGGEEPPPPATEAPAAPVLLQ